MLRNLRDIRKMKQEKRTFVEVNLSNISHNIRDIRKLLAPGVKFMAVVKADAYGHGAVAVSKAIARSVDYLSVATLSEALELKEADIKTPVFILSEVAPSNARYVVENGFIQTVYTSQLAKALSSAAGRLGRRARVHLKFDTGMGRIGAKPDEAVKIFNIISKMPGIKIEGVFTHLARAEEKNGFTKEQLRIFRDLVSRIDDSSLILHAANSAGTLYHKDSHLDMVRVGISMYGLYPPGGERTVELKPALEFRTSVVYLKKVPAGTPISYGSTYVADRETNIATLPVGYADGLPRALSNKGHVLINGRRYPIAGRVCMDITLADVKNGHVAMGDQVTLIGTQGKERITADDVASQAGTINYEIICGIGKRVPRIYKK